MRTKTTSSLASRPSHSHQYRSKEIHHHHHHGDVVEEIEGLIRVHRDGNVERPQIVSCVPASPCPDLNVISTDMAIDNFTGTWARFYVPNTTVSRHNPHQKLPLLIYFHGGGFCVGSASWVCYHEFLSKLSSKLSCLIMSINYRLAPENPLPAAYEDGFKSLLWVKQQILYQCEASQWWIQKCNFSRIFLAGDSAGANIAYNVALNLSTHEASSAMRPLDVKGMILIQPFFGGEKRTASEKKMGEAPSSALSLAASDTYWRLALPRGSNRDHQWCNPLGQESVRLEELRLCPVLVCVSELDILKDRNLELCGALVRAGKKVEHLVCRGVGHAFQILSKSQISQSQTHELMARIKSFVMGL
ncbi:probable carboxylesterase 6 [Neltuma alba]|uniref:probable carboxylesterase 6 n=1 Tax=Neltuma alba TaxID=207710 RepID=UPI0010A3633F|nr:probable carboxylesterase 6 [Prosopis alba]